MNGSSATVLLAHGSPDPRHAHGIERIAERWQARHRAPVAVAYLDHHEPRLATAIRSLPHPGAVTVRPLLLSRGLHLTEDVPAVIASAAADTGAEVQQGSAPLAVHGDWVRDAVAELASRLPGRPEPGHGLLVTAGTSNAAALQAWEEAAERWGWISVAHATGPGRTLTQAVAEAQRSGATVRFVVPVVLAEGRIVDKIAANAAALGLPVSSVIGTTTALLDALDPTAHRPDSETTFSTMSA